MPSSTQEDIRQFLAERDYFCTCGYNLRGLSSLLCPECAREIVLPPSEATDEGENERQLVAFLRTRDIYCKHCRCSMRASTSSRCPQCGAQYMLAVVGVSASHAPRPRDVVSGVTAVLTILAMLGSFATFMLIASRLPGSGSLPVGRLLLSLAPWGVLLLWSLWGASLQVRGEQHWIAGALATALSAGSLLLVVFTAIL